MALPNPHSQPDGTRLLCTLADVDLLSCQLHLHFSSSKEVAPKRRCLGNCTYKCTKKIKFVCSICLSHNVAVEGCISLPHSWSPPLSFAPLRWQKPLDLMKCSGFQFFVGPIIFDGAPWEQWIHENLCLVDVLAKDVEYHLENEQRTISTLAQS